MAPEDAADVLLAWCGAHGIIIDDRIHVVRGDEGDIAVFSGSDAVIERGTTLVTIPKTCILSIKSCALSDFIAPVIYGREAQLGLALGVYGELLKADTSLWAGYLHSLPDTVDLAYFWNDEDFDEDEDTLSAREWVKGTMADRELQGRNASSANSAKSPKHMNDLGVLDDIRRYYDAIAKSTLEKVGLGQSATLRGYKHAFALVSSRAFFVDAYHGLAMVPIADAFNHSLENQVHLESDYDVCPACGSLAECPHDAEDDNDTEEDDEKARHGPRTQCLDPADGMPKQTQVDAENTCEMVTNASIMPFGEVWNTYGESLTNAELLVRYGFVLDSNENDVIAWDPRDLRAFVSGVLGEEKGLRTPDDTSCDASSQMPTDSDDCHVRRTLSSQYQSLDGIGGERDRSILIIREDGGEARGQLSPETGVNDDRRLPDVPGSSISTPRPHTATSFVHKYHVTGSESRALNADTADDCSAAQGILDQLAELISRWHCGSSEIWGSSHLVYDPFSRDGSELHSAAGCEHRRRSCHSRVGAEEYEKQEGKKEVAVVDDIASGKTVSNISTPSTPGGLRGEEATRNLFENSENRPAAAAALGARMNLEDDQQSASVRQAQVRLEGDRQECRNEEDLANRRAETSPTIDRDHNNRESTLAGGTAASLRPSASCQGGADDASPSLRAQASVVIGVDVQADALGADRRREREGAVRARSGPPSLSLPVESVTAQQQQALGLMRRTDARLLAQSKPRRRLDVDLGFVKRVARAQVRLEELCEALVLEEGEAFDDADASGTRTRTRTKTRSASLSDGGGRRSWTDRPESFTGRRIGPVEGEGEGEAEALAGADDGTRTRTRGGLGSACTACAGLDSAPVEMDDASAQDDDGSGRTGSAIDAIRDYGDSEDEGDEAPERQGRLDVKARNEDDMEMEEAKRESESESAFTAGTKLRGTSSTAHEHQVPELVGIGGRHRDDSDDEREGRMKVSVSAGTEGERERKRRRRLANGDAAVTEFIPRHPGAGSPPAHVPRSSYASAPFELGSDLGAGAGTGGLLRAINLSPNLAREGRVPPPPPPLLPPSISAAGLRSPRRPQARDLAGGRGQAPSMSRSPRATDGRDDGCDRDRDRVVASGDAGDRDGESESGLRATRGRAAGADEAPAAANSVSEMMTGQGSGSARARLRPVAFGVRAGSGLDVDARVVIPVGAEVSPAHGARAGATSHGDPDAALGLVDLVASIARIVAALYKHRVQLMHVPAVDASALGELADAIPAENKKTRLAAQLALAERSLLESWGAAWDELRRRLESLAMSTE